MPVRSHPCPPAKCLPALASLTCRLGLACRGVSCKWDHKVCVFEGVWCLLRSVAFSSWFPRAAAFNRSPPLLDTHRAFGHHQLMTGFFRRASCCRKRLCGRGGVDGLSRPLGHRRPRREAGGCWGNCLLGCADLPASRHMPAVFRGPSWLHSLPELSVRPWCFNRPRACRCL